MESATQYAERLVPPPSWWLMGAALVVTVFWCFLVATPLRAAVIATVVAALLVGSVLLKVSVKVAVDGTGLRAGAAVLPWPYVGPVEALDTDATHRVIGVDADATAHLVVRAYCRTAVKVVVDDDRDPTPYWVVSTRHADRLAMHLRARSMRD